MSLASTYISRKELIADNLQSMGVMDASGDDGLTTLANKILDIEPSISGLNLDTGITVHSSDDSCLIGQSIMFWAELTAVYDDNTQVDVDLSGVLTGATVIFKSGNTVLGTGVTDNNGIASYTHTFEHTGEYSVTASFAGTENFDSCTSSAINVDVPYNMTITSDKSILSYNNQDVATITTTLEDDAASVSGKTLSYEILDNNDNILDSGSDVTDASGEIEFTYNSLGIGDVTVVVYSGMILKKTFVIEDCIFYDDATSSRTSLYDTTQSSNQTFTYDSTHSAYQFHRISNGFGTVLINDVSVPNRVEITCKLRASFSGVNNQPRICVFNNGNGVGQRFMSDNSMISTMGYTSDGSVITQKSRAYSTNTWYILKLTIDGTSITGKYYDESGTLLDTVTGTSSVLASTGNLVGVQMAYSNNAIALFKELKIKLL